MEQPIISKHPIKFINVNTVKYCYIEKGKGPTIILLHGFPDTASTWDSIIDTLSQNYRCIAPFLRGYYPTDIPKSGNYSIAALAKDIHFIAKKLTIKEYHLIGHDWGASIAYALTNIYPKEVLKTCAISLPHPRFLKPNLKLLYKARHVLLCINSKKAIKKVKKNDFEYLETLYKRWSPNWKNYNLNLARVIHSFNKESRTKAAISYYNELKNTHPNLVTFYRKTPLKNTLVLVGKKDGAIDLNQFKKMKQHPCFTVIIHLTAGHFIHKEDELFCLDQILNFINN